MAIKTWVPVEDGNYEEFELIYQQIQIPLDMKGHLKDIEDGSAEPEDFSHAIADLPENLRICKQQDMTYEEWLAQVVREMEWWRGVAYSASLHMEVHRLNQALEILEEGS